MRFIILFLASVLLVSCSSSRFYTYKAVMQPSTRTDSLFYENDSLAIQFTLKPKLIAFKMSNKLSQGIKINWDEVSISINGKSYRVVHKETGTFKIRDIQPVTSIPPKSYLTDGLIPTEKIYYYTNTANGNSIVSVSDIFPYCDYGNKSIVKKAQGLKNAFIVIYLPIYIGNSFSSNAFEIRINDVISSKTKPKATI